MTNKQILEKIESIDKFLEEEDYSDDTFAEMLNARNNLIYDIVDNCGRKIFDTCHNRFEKCWTCENHENYMEREGLYKELVSVELKQIIDDYFSNITKEELMQVLIDNGLGVIEQSPNEV